jgi:hypothetical protein
LKFVFHIQSKFVLLLKRDMLGLYLLFTAAFEEPFMSETITWSLTAGGTSGSAIQTKGVSVGDAIISVSVDLDAGSAARDLALQVDTVDNVAFLAISSDLLDGSVTVKADGASATALNGPILLFGGAVKLFAGDLTTLTVHDTSAVKAAKVSVLIGLKV